MALLEINDLKTYFPIRSGLLSRHLGDVKAVDGVTLNVEDGETLGLVGESGCGKSTLGRSVLRLIEPTEGRIIFEDREILSLGHSEMRDMRRRMQIIFQDPYASLNPRMRVGEIVGEGLKIHGLASGRERRDITMQILNRVGLREEHYERYPHEFSGGQRQRIGVARALIFRPRLIIADEPVSALDVSIQAQILNLLEELQDEFNLTYIFISHDLRVVEHVSHRVAIMYLGKIVEVGKSETIYVDAKHPYTRALLSAVPMPDPDAKEKKKRVTLQGDVPSPINPPSGCSFHPRCAFAEKICGEREPALDHTDDGHLVACHVFGPGAKH
jgi:oligopeptide/dipeptide ABC transporter ATP-binding protein